MAKKPSKKPAKKPVVKKAAAKSAAKKTAVKAAAKKAAKPAAKKAAPKKAAKPAKAAAKKAAPAPKKAPAKSAAKAAPGKKAAPIPAPAGKKAEKVAKGKGGKEPKAVVEADPTLEADATADAPAEEVYLTDAEGRRYCRVKDCDQLAAVDAYCRYHYLLFWKKIQVRKKILTEGKLERYIEDLTARYPDKFLDMLRKDLRSEKEFLAAIQELEIDESAVDNEFEDEAQTYIDEVRGDVGGGGGGAREEEDF